MVHFQDSPLARHLRNEKTSNNLLITFLTLCQFAPGDGGCDGTFPGVEAGLAPQMKRVNNFPRLDHGYSCIFKKSETQAIFYPLFINLYLVSATVPRPQDPVSNLQKIHTTDQSANSHIGDKLPIKSSKDHRAINLQNLMPVLYRAILVVVSLVHQLQSDPRPTLCNPEQCYRRRLVFLASIPGNRDPLPFLDSVCSAGHFLLPSPRSNRRRSPVQDLLLREPLIQRSLDFLAICSSQV